MDEKGTIFPVEDSEWFTRHRPTGVERRDLTIDVFGRPLTLTVGYEEGPARLADTVPAARAICDTLCAAVAEHLAAEGRPVSCRKGCSACCGYLVSVSAPEIYALQQMMTQLPAGECRRLLENCITTATQILDKDLLHKHHIGNDAQSADISAWYQELNVKCPFLAGQICRIYDQRPLACREFMVTSAPADCRTDTADEPEVVNLPFSVLEALARLAAALEQTEVQADMLPLALACSDRYYRRSQQTWPASELVRRFLAILQRMAARARTDAAMQAG